MWQTTWKRSFFVRYCDSARQLQGSHNNWMWLLPTPDVVFSEVACSCWCDKHDVKSVTVKCVRKWVRKQNLDAKQEKVYPRLYREENIYVLHFALPLTSITPIALRILKITVLIVLTIKKVRVKWRLSSCCRTMESTLSFRAELWLLASNISVSF